MSVHLMAWASEQAFPIELGASKSLTRFSVDPANAHVGFRVHSDGTLDGAAGTSLSWSQNLGTWLVARVAADYDVRATLVSGDVPDGEATGDWVNCGTTRSWSHSVLTIVAPKQSQLLIELSFAGLQTPIDSCTVNLHATVETNL